MAESKYWYAVVDSWGNVYRYYGELSAVVDAFYADGHSGPATVTVIDMYESGG